MPTAILKPLHARRTRPAPPAPAGALASARQRALHVSTLRSSSSTPQDRREGQGLDLITTLSSSTQELHEYVMFRPQVMGSRPFLD
ncbi:unnamed protein product [Tilletia caries]|uniref:Uncharacterized protein n=1 Tax=Tilletia caries TaxID=13290 RepID=A0ABN7IS09_9BASI|nr:unnamed protein product [Tilletia caries]